MDPDISTTKNALGVTETQDSPSEFFPQETTLRVGKRDRSCVYPKKVHLEPQGQPFINGCFNWMIPNLYIGNGCFTKHLFINGCLGFQASLWIHRHPVTPSEVRGFVGIFLGVQIPNLRRWPWMS